MKLSVIVKKELLDQLRDRRTIIAAILMPAVIVPLLLTLTLPGKTDEELSEPIKIILQDDDPYLKKIISESCSYCEFINPDSPSAAMLDGSADLQIQITKQEEEYRSIIISYDPARSISFNASISIKNTLESELKTKPAELKEIQITSSTIRSGEENKTLMTLSLILPVFLMLFAASSAISAAIDMSSGEKERSTIEILLSCSISHAEIIIGKILAAAVIGISSISSLLAGLALSSHFYPQITGGISLLKFCGITYIVLIFFMTSISVFLFASAGMVIGLFAKSVREGTILSLPVIILSSALSSGIISGDPYAIDKTCMLIPVLNFSCLIRSAVFSHFELSSFAVSFFINMACACLFLFISSYLIKKESVIFRS